MTIKDLDIFVFLVEKLGSFSLFEITSRILLVKSTNTFLSAIFKSKLKNFVLIRHLLQDEMMEVLMLLFLEGKNFKSYISPSARVCCWKC